MVLKRSYFVNVSYFEQGEDFAIPATSVPYSILEANPFTTALVAQIPASNSTSAKRVVREPGSASGHEWSHTVAFEVSWIDYTYPLGLVSFMTYPHISKKKELYIYIYICVLSNAHSFGNGKIR